ncbi:MAG: IS5/IS1182 family transposase, partial [Dehalococcoidales bacterium]|nr:IS5/IS1182 family transposase [Dehalococcoidales bacterium]
MNQTVLPIELPDTRRSQEVGLTQCGDVRVRKPVRNQAEMLVRDLDSLVAEDHPARAIWDFLSKLDLAVFYRSIRVTLDQPGRPASDPQVLLALWVYATVEGVGS